MTHPDTTGDWLHLNEPKQAPRYRAIAEGALSVSGAYLFFLLEYYAICNVALAAFATAVCAVFCLFASATRPPFAHCGD